VVHGIGCPRRPPSNCDHNPRAACAGRRRGGLVVCNRDSRFWTSLPRPVLSVRAFRSPEPAEPLIDILYERPPNVIPTRRPFDDGAVSAHYAEAGPSTSEESVEWLAGRGDPAAGDRIRNPAMPVGQLRAPYVRRFLSDAGRPVRPLRADSTPRTSDERARRLVFGEAGVRRRHHRAGPWSAAIATSPWMAAAVKPLVPRTTRFVSFFTSVFDPERPQDSPSTSPQRGGLRRRRSLRFFL